MTTYNMDDASTDAGDTEAIPPRSTWIKVFINRWSDLKLEQTAIFIDVTASMKILRAATAEVFKVPVEFIMALYQGEPIEDDDTAEALGMQNNDAIDMVVDTRSLAAYALQGLP